MLSFEEACALATTLPGVEIGTSYGTPALTARKKAFARLWEDGTTLVLKVPFDVRDHLLAANPAAFFVSDHYRGYPAVLVRLAQIDGPTLAPLLEEAWRQVASQAMLRQHAVREGGSPS